MLRCWTFSHLLILSTVCSKSHGLLLLLLLNLLLFCLFSPKDIILSSFDFLVVYLYAFINVILQFSEAFVTELIQFKLKDRIAVIWGDALLDNRNNLFLLLLSDSSNILPQFGLLFLGHGSLFWISDYSDWTTLLLDSILTWFWFVGNYWLSLVLMIDLLLGLWFLLGFDDLRNWIRLFDETQSFEAKFCELFLKS